MCAILRGYKLNYMYKERKGHGWHDAASSPNGLSSRLVELIRKPGRWHVADGGEPLHPSVVPHADLTQGEQQ